MLMVERRGEASPSFLLFEICPTSDAQPLVSDNPHRHASLSLISGGRYTNCQSPGRNAVLQAQLRIEPTI
ncbi:MAG: hypothetical protein QOJ52_4068 [Acidimicrobiaceae bacterium]|nr:hypothetical protein [Acidimicrobiaceae bacterium]